MAKPDAKTLEILRAESLEGIPWLVHGFSTRQGGVSTCYGGKTLNLGQTEHDTDANVECNRVLFLKALSAVSEDGSPWPLAQVRQIHSAIIHRVDARSLPAPSGDGLITNDAGILLAIKTADCVPV